PKKVATEWMPAARSAATSWTAPKAWLAMPHSTNAAAMTHASRLPGSAPATTSAYTSGPTKCIADVKESSTGRSLNRAPGAEYNTTPATTRMSVTPAHSDPTHSSHA